MVGEPIQQRAGEALGSEHGRPFVEGQVRRDDDRAALVALREDFEQQLGADLRERDVAEFVDDQELHVLQLRLELEQQLDNPRGEGLSRAPSLFRQSRRCALARTRDEKSPLQTMVVKGFSL